VHVEWKDPEGKLQSFRVENWLHNIQKRAKITTEPFIYTSSPILPDGSFLAEQTGSILGLYVDPGCLVNNPRDGNDDDEIWVNDPAVPAKGTPVTLIFKQTAEALSAKPVEPKKTDDAKKAAPEAKPDASKPTPRKKSSAR
jgi:hypothetical protein